MMEEQLSQSSITNSELEKVLHHHSHISIPSHHHTLLPRASVSVRSRWRGWWPM